MKNYFYMIFSFTNWLFFSLQVIHAIREVGTSLIICDMLVYCSFCNYQFSENVLKLLMVKKSCFLFLCIKYILMNFALLWCFNFLTQYTNNIPMFFNHFQHQYMTAPSNELKPVFSLLTELLVSMEGKWRGKPRGFSISCLSLIVKHLFPYCFLVVGLNPNNFMSEFGNFILYLVFFYFQVYIIKRIYIIMALILVEIIRTVYIYIEDCQRKFQSSVWWFFFKMLEDPVQGQRIKVVIDGVTDSAGTAYDGLLGIN